MTVIGRALAAAESTASGTVGRASSKKQGKTERGFPPASLAAHTDAAKSITAAVPSGSRDPCPISTMSLPGTQQPLSPVRGKTMMLRSLNSPSQAASSPKHSCIRDSSGRVSRW
jgi:hypothetical protein